MKRFAEQGRALNVGGISGYRAPGPFGLGDFVGLVLLEAKSIPGVMLPNGAFCGVFLTEGDMMAASCAVSRVIHQLGKHAHYFPAPYWSDPARQSVYAPGDTALQPSLQSGMS